MFAPTAWYKRGRPALNWGRKWRYLVRVLPFCIALAFFINNTHHPVYIPTRSRRDPTSFWANAFLALEDARPKALPVKPDGEAPGKDWLPGVDHSRPNLTVMTEQDQLALRDSHASFVRSISRIAHTLVYDRQSTGIVATAGALNFGQAVTMVLMVRRSGSTLPIHLVLDSTASWIDKLCDGYLLTLNVACLQLPQLWARLPKSPPKFDIFQWKILSILASPFQTLLFLDVDAFPVFNPDGIFAPGSQPLSSTGLITWPDFWTSSVSHLFYSIAGDIEPPPIRLRSTSESGIMVIDKAKHGGTMLLALYYNFYGPDYYYPLLSQGGPGEGDKETFLHAALVLEELRRRDKSLLPFGLEQLIGSGTNNRESYYDVKTMPKSWGRTVRGTWKGMFMQQMDPMDDYKYNARTESEKEKESTHSKDAKETGALERNSSLRIRGGSALSDASAEAGGNQYMIREAVRPMFFHHNGIKLDFTKLTQQMDNPIIAQGEDGRAVRLWGDPGWIIQLTGRDVERELWRDSTKFYCEHTDLHDVCRIMMDNFFDVY